MGAAIATIAGVGSDKTAGSLWGAASGFPELGVCGAAGSDAAGAGAPGRVASGSAGAAETPFVSSGTSSQSGVNWLARRSASSNDSGGFELGVSSFPDIASAPVREGRLLRREASTRPERRANLPR